MKQKVPTSPFATRLSGSAKETELRLRNIFQWKKKRPPVIALAAAVLIIAACGTLIGFTSTDVNVMTVPNGVKAMKTLQLSDSLVYAVGEETGTYFDLYWMAEGQEPDLLCRFSHWGRPNLNLEKIQLGQHCYLLVQHVSRYPDVFPWYYKKFTDIFCISDEGAPIYTLQIEGRFSLSDTNDDGVQEIVCKNGPYAAMTDGRLLRLGTEEETNPYEKQWSDAAGALGGNRWYGIDRAPDFVRIYEEMDLLIHEDSFTGYHPE